MTNVEQDFLWLLQMYSSTEKYIQLGFISRFPLQFFCLFVKYNINSSRFYSYEKTCLPFVYESCSVDLSFWVHFFFSGAYRIAQHIHAHHRVQVQSVLKCSTLHIPDLMLALTSDLSGQGLNISAVINIISCDLWPFLQFLFFFTPNVESVLMWFD